MADLVRVSLSGEMPGGEKWSVNPCFGFSVPTAVSSDEAQAMATAIAAVNAGSDLLVLNTGGVTLSHARVEARSKAGVLESVAEAAKGSPQVGSAGTGHPFQTSAVFSLLTTNSTATGKGRLYWPATGAAVGGGTLRWGSTQQTAALTAMQTYLSGVQTAIRSITGFSGAFLGVWSRKNQIVYPVLKLRAGDVLDTQRRRRDKLIETYVSINF